MSYQKKVPTYERFILDPANPTWRDDLNVWLDGLFPDVEVLEDPERGGAETGFWNVRAGDYYYPLFSWGDQLWVVLHNNVDKSITEVSTVDFDKYYETA